MNQKVDDEDELPVCEGMCTVAEFKEKLIPHAEIAISKPFTVNSGTTEFVYREKYQADYL